MRQMNERGYVFLENEEGERLYTYDDATGREVKAGEHVVGTLTAGVGHTGPDVIAGMKVTAELSRAWFDHDTDWAEECVDQTCPGANNNEFNAMASLCFNIGKAGFKGSTVARLFNKGDKAGAASAFSLWNRDQFGVNKVLVARRAREAAVFLEPLASEVPKPMPQMVLAPTPIVQSKTVITGGLAGAATVASVAEQVNQIQPTLDAINTAGTSMQSLLKLGGIGLSVIALVAIGYFVYRYIQKHRRGEVAST